MNIIICPKNISLTQLKTPDQLFVLLWTILANIFGSLNANFIIFYYFFLLNKDSSIKFSSIGYLSMYLIANFYSLFVIVIKARFIFYLVVL